MKLGLNKWDWASLILQGIGVLISAGVLIAGNKGAAAHINDYTKILKPNQTPPTPEA